VEAEEQLVGVRSLLAIAEMLGHSGTAITRDIYDLGLHRRETDRRRDHRSRRHSGQGRDPESARAGQRSGMTGSRGSSRRRHRPGTRRAGLVGGDRARPRTACQALFEASFPGPCDKSGTEVRALMKPGRIRVFKIPGPILDHAPDGPSGWLDHSIIQNGKPQLRIPEDYEFLVATGLVTRTAPLARERLALAAKGSAAPIRSRGWLTVPDCPVDGVG
jgi:hypothetical protein